MPLPRHLWLRDSLRELLGGSTRTGAALLGEDHPLVRVLDLLGVITRQALAVAIVIVLGALGVAQHLRDAVSILVAAAVVEFALVAAIALLVQLKRERARDLIIEGHQDLPLPSVAAERDRLLDQREQRSLARALERILHAAENYDRLLIASRPPPGTRRLREIAPELCEIAACLHVEEVGVRGVARVSRLLTGGYASPFYTGRIREVQLELERIRSEFLSDGRRESTNGSPQQREPGCPASRASRSPSAQPVSDQGGGRSDRARQRSHL